MIQFRQILSPIRVIENIAVSQTSGTLSDFGGVTAGRAGEK
jgi:hypothetical protein